MGPPSPPVLILPGWTNSGAEHWQSRWLRDHPEWQRIEQADWDRPDPLDWVTTLEAAVAGANEPPVLVGHSLGALTIAKWGAGQPTTRVAGALLVAPADVERPDAPPILRPFAPLPTAALPFPSILVASRNDAYLAWERATMLAEAWGARLHDAGRAGHINTDAGYGPWPEGERLLAQLVARAA